MTKRVDLSVLTDYNTIDKVIDVLMALREEHGSGSIVDLNLETNPYETEPHIEASLLVKE